MQSRCQKLIVVSVVKKFLVVFEARMIITVIKKSIGKQILQTRQKTGVSICTKIAFICFISVD